MSLYILDVQIAIMFHHDPLLRHDSTALYAAADDDVFNAPTAREWKAKILGKMPMTRPLSSRMACSCQFTSYLDLQRISAKICQEQSRGRLEVASAKFRLLADDLITWRRKFDEEPPTQNEATQSDTFSLIILWHAIFMGLLTDFNKLERALGREGQHNASIEPDLAYAVHWSTSTAAERCILHAHEIQQRLSQMPLNTEPAIHVMHCAFLAGIASYSCLRFRRPAMLSRYPSHHRAMSPRSLSNLPEFNLDGIAQLGDRLLDLNASPVLFENERGELFMRTIQRPHKVMLVGAEIFRQCHDVLDKIGHFDVARSYAKVLKALVGEEIEEWMHGS